MENYIILCNYTQKGIENIKESPNRLDAAKQIFKAIGESSKRLICEVPDAETGAKISLAIGSRGAVRTESLRAYPEADYRKIIEAFP